MFTTGSRTLSIGTTTYTISFSSPFTSPPQLVGCFVQNTVDGSPLLLNNEVTNITETGFTVQLAAAPDTVNYVLTYIAGSPASVISAIQAIGRRGTELPLMSGAMQNNYLFFGVKNDVYPTTVAYSYEYMKTLFLSQLAAVPSAPTSPGEQLQMAVDANYLYVHTGTSSARIPLFKSEWGITDVARKTQHGVFNCTSGTQIQTITFPAAFDTNDLNSPNKMHIKFNIANIADADPIQVLTGMLRSFSNTGFTIVLSDQPSTANYRLHWEAKIIT